MGSRPRRFHPGRGFRCIRDAGSMAIWMRLEPDQSVTAVVRLEGYGDGYDGVWTINAERGSDALYNVMDKAHRVRWAWGEGNKDHLFGCPISHQPLPKASSKRRAPKNRTWAHRGLRKPHPRHWGRRAHTRWRKRRDPLDPWSYGMREMLPRKFREQRGDRHG